MTLRYVDTSALVRCYFPDEPDHTDLRETLLEGTEPVVTSELTRVELVSALYAAHRDHRVSDPAEVLALVDLDCGPDGPITLLRLETADAFPTVAQLLARFPLRTLDAIHLAVAGTTGVELAGGDPPMFVTRDHRQRAAAEALGLPVG